MNWVFNKIKKLSEVGTFSLGLRLVEGFGDH